MNEVIRQIQATRDNCVSELWNPKAADTGSSRYLSVLGGTLPKLGTTEAKVGDLTIPRGLFAGTVVGTSLVRDSSGRNANNDILVYWGTANHPSDNAACWMFVSRLNNWDENY